MIALQLTKMDEAHRLAHPAHISLMLRQSVDRVVLNEIATIAEVAGVDSLTPVSLRFRTDSGHDWQMATLVLRQPPLQQQFDLMTLQRGRWPQAGEIAIENLTAEQTGLHPGDWVELSDGGTVQALVISGIVRHPFVKPPRFGGQAHFFADQSQASRFGMPSERYRQILLQARNPDADAIRQLAHSVKTQLAVRHIDVNATLLQDPEHHWGRPFIAGIDQVLQWLALVSLLLASVLIANSVSAHINQQGEQIGVMKALGGAIWTIAAVYVLEVLIMALLAIALALVPSLWLANWSACRVLGLFNIGCEGFAYAPDAVAIMLSGGLLVPLLAAAWPIGRGARLTVRAALASYGLGSDFGSNRLDRAVEWLGVRFLPTVYAAALANLLRRKGRLLLTQTVLIAAGLMFLVLMSLIASLNLTLDNELARTRYALRLSFSRDQPASTIERLTGLTQAGGDLELWQRWPLVVTYQNQPLRQHGSLGLQLLGLPVTGRLYQPYIEQGRWFAASDQGERVVVISADSARLNGVQPGDNLELRVAGHVAQWRIIGTYRWLAGNNFAVEPVYAPKDSVPGFNPQQPEASYALLKATGQDAQQENAWLRELSARLEAESVMLDAYNTQSRLQQRQYARNQFKSVMGTLIGLAAMVVAVGGIGLSGTLAIGVMQRQREIAVLRAIGASGGTVFRLVMLEGVLHAGLAWIVTVPLAWWLAQPLAAELGRIMLALELDYRFAYQAALAWLVVIVLLAITAAWWPARRAMRLTVRDALH